MMNSDLALSAAAVPGRAEPFSRAVQVLMTLKYWLLSESLARGSIEIGRAAQVCEALMFDATKLARKDRGLLLRTVDCAGTWCRRAALDDVPAAQVI